MTTKCLRDRLPFIAEDPTRDAPFESFQLRTFSRSSVGIVEKVAEMITFCFVSNHIEQSRFLMSTSWQDGLASLHLQGLSSDLRNRGIVLPSIVEHKQLIRANQKSKETTLEFMTFVYFTCPQ